MMAEWITALLVAIFGGGGLWAWMSASRTATSSEYKQFVQDLQQERRDREAAMAALRAELNEERDARAETELLILDLIAHTSKLERIIVEHGGVVPMIPERVNIYLHANGGGKG